MALYFQVLASGSKGNSVLVCGERTRVLMDAGLSAKDTARRLEGTPGEGCRLDAIVISHEHQDHVRGCGILSRRHNLPVYLSRGTRENLPGQVGELHGCRIFQPGTGFVIGDLRITPFAISHDATEPVGFVVECGGARLGICTDLGVATQLVRTRLQGCHGLVLEANHDVETLLNGPYPWHLKQRIRSRQGHLCNEDSLTLLEELRHEKLQTVVFAHLSEVNNRPYLVRKAFETRACPELRECVKVMIGCQDQVTTGVQLDG